MRTSEALALVLLIVTGACTTSEPAATTTTNVPPIPATTSTTTTTTPSSEPCPTDEAFVEGGVVEEVEQPADDSNAIGRIGWSMLAECEVFTFSFQTSEGAPATTPPPLRIVYLDSQQILRIYVDADSTMVVDQLVETPLVDRLFVVRGLDDRMFIDLHLAAPAQARAQVDLSPARLVLYLQPGLIPFEGIATVGDRVVVISPLPGARTERLLQVSGYTRIHTEVKVIATAGGTLVGQTSTTPQDHPSTWREFVTTIDLPVQDISLFVGEQKAEDGSLKGVTISLDAP